MIDFSKISGFERDYKKIKKKHRTLDDDFDDFMGVLQAYPKGTGAKHWVILTEREDVLIFKARMPGTFKGKFLRVVYAYYEKENSCIFIEFLEIFDHASGKMREDKKRIDEYLKMNS